MLHYFCNKVKLLHRTFALLLYHYRPPVLPTAFYSTRCQCYIDTPYIFMSNFISLSLKIGLLANLWKTTFTSTRTLFFTIFTEQGHSSNVVWVDRIQTSEPDQTPGSDNTQWQYSRPDAIPDSPRQLKCLTLQCIADRLKWSFGDVCLDVRT